MKKIRQLILFLPLVASAALFAAGKVRATGSNPAPVVAPFHAPMSCTSPIQGVFGKSVTITAGPNGQFPQPLNGASCPGGSGNCLKWEYRFVTTGGVTQSYTLLTAPSDLQIISGLPSAVTVLNPPGVRDAKLRVGAKIFDVQSIRHTVSPAPATTFTASFFTTDKGVEIGNITAGVLATTGPCDDDYRNTGFCAIAGPTTTPQGFEGSPVANITSTLCFTNGCCYEATAGARDNIIISMTAVTSPQATEDCTVTIQPDICESETGTTFCPPLELGRPPLQGTPGGTCYAPPNIKFKC
jgi:hypothetical protein